VDPNPKGHTSVFVKSVIIRVLVVSDIRCIGTGWRTSWLTNRDSLSSHRCRCARGAAGGRGALARRSARRYGYASKHRLRSWDCRAAPAVKVVASASETERDLLACAEAGVAGYVPRAASVQDL